MPKEQTHTAIILKKQAFGEADEIITAFSREQGKIRFLAKSVKRPKSKLQHALQVPFLVELRLTQARGLQRVISCVVLESFGNIRNSSTGGRSAFYGLETVLKSTADGQKNLALFTALKIFLENIDSPRLSKIQVNLALLKFKIQALNALGLAISSPQEEQSGQIMGFSNSLGGFIQKNCFDFRPVTRQAHGLFLSLSGSAEFAKPPILSDQGQTDELHNLLSGFLEYHLEREIKSEKFLNG